MRAGRFSGLWLVCAVTTLAGCSRGQDSATLGAAPTKEHGGPFVRVLGTVQDGGLPHVACSCDRCEMARSDPSQRRHIASLALVLPASGKIYLIDATPDLRQQLDSLRDFRDAPEGRVDRSPVDGVFLTHAHIGHYLGLAFLGYEAVHASRLPVMASPRLVTFLRDNGPWSQLVALENVVLREIAPGDRHELEDGVVVTALSAPHRDEYADTLGFVINGPKRRLLYLPDTDSWVAWRTPVEESLRDIDVALLDGTFFSLDELPGRSIETIGHPLVPTSMDRFASLIEETGIDIYFTHLNHSNPAIEAESAARREIVRRGFHVLAERQEFPL